MDNQNFYSALMALRQQFPHLGAPQEQKVSPQMRKIQAIMAAKQQAAELTQGLQHMRRFNGPY